MTFRRPLPVSGRPWTPSRIRPPGTAASLLPGWLYLEDEGGRNNGIPLPGDGAFGAGEAVERRPETFEELHCSLHIVIPAKAGIQCFQELPGFRFRPGIAEKVVFQSLDLSS